MLLSLWRRCFPEKLQRPTDLSGHIRLFEEIQDAYVQSILDAESRVRLAERKAGLTQSLKYDESRDTF